MRFSGIVGIVGALVTMAWGLYLVYLMGAMGALVSVWGVGEEDRLPVLASLLVVAAATLAIPFATVSILQRGGHGPWFVGVAGAIACGAQLAFAFFFGSSSTESRWLFIVQPGILLVVAGALGVIAGRRHRFIPTTR